MVQRAEQQVRRRSLEAEYGQGLLALCSGQWRPQSCSGAARVVCVNMSAAVDCNHLVADGVHPALSGAKLMAARWYGALVPLLDSVESHLRSHEALKRTR